MAGKKNSINVIEYDLEDALDFIRQKWNAGLYKVPILLAGAPGIGKTEGIQAIFEEYKVPVYEHRIGNMDPSDVRGVPVIDQITEDTKGNDGNVGDFICREALPDGNVLPRSGPCVLFLDELGHAKTATLNAWMPLLKERKIGTYRAPASMMIIGATNRVSDRAGSNAMHSALINRVIRIDVKHNPRGWLKWAQTADQKTGNEPVCSEIRSYIAWKNDALLQPNEDAQSVDSPFPSPRSWTNLSREIEKLPSKRHWQMLANGTIGQAAAIEWIKFTEIYSQLPRWEDIAANPKGIAVPNELSVKWALVGYLSDTCKNKQLVSTKQLEALCQFIVRLPSDFSVLAFNPIINARTTDLVKLPSFKAWIQKNRHHVTNSSELLI